MKKVIKFSKLFIPCSILSAVLIILGFAGLFMKGINFGIDFQAGFIEKIKVAPTAFTLTYDGPKTVIFSQSSSGIDIVITSIDGDSETLIFPYNEYKTVADFVDKVKTIDGIKVELKAPASTGLEDVFTGSQNQPHLSVEPFVVHYMSKDHESVPIEKIRQALSSLQSVSVQQLGVIEDAAFQVRISDNGTYEDANTELKKLVNDALYASFGKDNIAILSTDFVGVRFSGSLAKQAVLLVLGALVLIFIYAMIRFHWDFALGAIIALLHDAMIMIAFIVWIQMEFNSTTIAAILTIIGYSINDTVVIFDRIRENIWLNPKEKCVDILDLSLSEMLGRTIITTLTTMLAVLVLYIFTEGSIKDFALALLVGMVSGVYSSIYITGACITFFNRKGDKLFKAKKPSSL